MREYQIITDTNSDLPEEYIKEAGLLQVPQYTLFEGVTYEGARGIDPAYFYNKMAEGAMPQSQAINPAVTEEEFRKILDAGKDILYISFASTLSGSCNTAMMVAKELSEEYPDARINVVDTLAASIGEGLLVIEAVKMQKQGKDIDEVTKWLEDHKLNLVTELTVDDIKHLQRGGRVSKTVAVVGSLINIKPFIKVSPEGKLVADGTARGRKKSLSKLVSLVEEKMTGEWKDADTIIGIAHANSPEDAKSLAGVIEEKFNKKVIINDINPSIGVHTGPGAILITFFGTER